MGMYDSVKIDIKCPYCGKVSEMEAQTKELDSMLSVWRKGDFVNNDRDHLECLTICDGSECKKSKRFFTVKILLEKGRVSGKYKIIK